MIKKLLATTALVAMPFAASAADLAVKAPLRAPAPEFTWVGYYAGGTFGYAGLKVGTPEVGANGDRVLSGFTGGLHAGVNWQSGNIVYGFEGDVAAVSAAGHFPGFGTGTSTAFSTRLTATLRGRLGVAFNRNLFYATGGLSYLNGRTHTDDNNGEEKNHNLFGYVVGGGWEYAYNNNLIIRVVEAQYHGYHKTVNYDNSCVGCGEVGAIRDLVTVRTGLSYKF